MNKINLRSSLALFSVSILVFLAFMYISSLREEVAALENQKQNLLQDIEKGRNTLKQFIAINISLRGYLKAARQRLDKSFLENAALAKEKEQLSRENESKPVIPATKVKIEVTPAAVK